MTRARRTTPETAVLKAIKNYLSARGILVFRANVATFRNAAGRPVRCGTKGHPDLYGVLPKHQPRGGGPTANGPGILYPPGRAFFCEVKAGDNQPTKLQAAVMDALSKAGAAVCVARSIQDIEDWLHELGV